MSIAVSEVLTRLGGVARRGDLISLTSRAAVDGALAAGEVSVLSRGVYACAGADVALRTAGALSGTVSHLSAAMHHGWAVKATPEHFPEVIVPRGRRLSPAQHRTARITRADLTSDEVAGGVTSRDRTILDCLRREPFDAAVAVADSALREGYSHTRMAALARDARGRHVHHIRRVVAEASGEAANPFESVLRAISRDVPRLCLRPQVPLFGSDFLGRPDLVDTDLRIIVEADSFAWHGDRAALRADARRYDEFVAHGWLVLRFAWEDVMFDQTWVRSVLERAVRVSERAS